MSTDITGRAIAVASKFRKSLTQNEMLSLAKTVQQAIKVSLQEDRQDRIDTVTKQLEVLLVECESLESTLRMGEDEVSEELATFQEYRTWRRGVVDKLRQKRAEYRELKLSRHAIQQRKELK